MIIFVLMNMENSLAREYNCTDDTKVGRANVSSPCIATLPYTKADEIEANKPNVPFPSPADPSFNFIDLFAGVGGFRIAMQRQGASVFFSSEWDKFAQQTYLANYGELP